MHVRDRVEMAVMMASLFPNCPVIENVCEEKPLPKKKIATVHLGLKEWINWIYVRYHPGFCG